ncbi:hypothetical protein [Streptomyces sp. NBC_00286]|uniref:hypothetical protein n=1 Tax=Streptomyces sp. NBC_00286 TaxID=2975701 RepID=UPI003FA6F53B
MGEFVDAEAQAALALVHRLDREGLHRVLGGIGGARLHQGLELVGTGVPVDVPDGVVVLEAVDQAGREQVQGLSGRVAEARVALEPGHFCQVVAS